MIKQNINIVNYQTLYNILEEIKTYLSFNIFNYFDEKEFLKHLGTNEIDIKKSLFLVKKKDKFFYKNLKINKNQIFEIPDLPINLYSLIEKINIQLIKYKYSFQSKILVKKYSLDLNSRIISKDKNKLKLTEREMEIIIFLNESKIPQKITDLQNKVWGYSSELETHTVETHVYRLRKKISDSFNDEQFLISTDDGYLIE